MSDNSLEHVLVSELLAERKRDRRFKYIRLALVVGMAALFSTLSYQGMQEAKSRAAEDAQKPRVAAVRLTGPIGAGQSASIARLSRPLEEAFSDENAKAVFLLINSPGGTPVQASMLHDHITRLKKKYAKPVIAVAEDSMTSGAYLVAMAADEIVVNPSSVVGSIGVIHSSFGMANLMDKLGVERRVITSGTSKSQLDPFLPLQSADVERLKGILGEVHAQFIEAVKKGRGAKLKASDEELFNGNVWTGATAVRLGVADVSGDAVGYAQKRFAVDSIKVYEGSVSLAEQFRRLAGGSAADVLVESAIERLGEAATTGPQLR